MNERNAALWTALDEISAEAGKMYHFLMYAKAALEMDQDAIAEGFLEDAVKRYDAFKASCAKHNGALTDHLLSA